MLKVLPIRNSRKQKTRRRQLPAGADNTEKLLSLFSA